MGVEDRQFGWESEARPHYVTLRLADAMPRSVMEAWHDDIDRRVRILTDMKGRPLLPDEERNLVQRTIGRIERFLDSGHGSCVLSDERAAGLVESIVWSGDHSRYELHAWSVMPNHLHALVTPIAPTTVDELLHEWKYETTRRVNQELRRAGNLWHPDVIDYPVSHPADFARLRSTITTNPERVGLHEWPFAGEESRPLAHA
jgi:REP element-mobilizing transposase RayT